MRPKPKEMAKAESSINYLMNTSTLSMYPCESSVKTQEVTPKGQGIKAKAVTRTTEQVNAHIPYNPISSKGSI